MAVFVDQAVEDGLSPDAMGLEVGDGGRGGWFSAVRGQLLSGLVGAVLVEVIPVVWTHLIMDLDGPGGVDPHGTFKDVAADLNVNPETLRTWMRDADGRPASAAASQGTEAEPARLRAENARPAKAEKEWQLEREILRRAAAHFAREMK